MNQGYDYSSFGESRDSIASYTAKTYGWMFLGLLTTFVAAAAIYFTGFYIPLCTAMNGLLPLVLALVELGVVIYLSARIHKIPVATARLLFFVYALLNAVTFSTILAVYSMQSLILVFAMTSLYFGVMAVYGYVTKADLTRIRPVLTFGLVALIVMMLLSLFIPGMNTGMCLVGIVIFLGFTAYDTQMIRRNYAYYSGNPELLQKALRAVVPTTYNQMSVDLDTSTNDTLIIMASGLAGNPEICEENADYEAFVAALTAIAEHMCAEHAGDGEGATHLITCEVTHAPTHEIARAVAKSVVCSSLTKAAMFGADANWGRVLCAIGYSGAKVDIDKIDVSFSSAAGSILVCKGGCGVDFSEEKAKEILLKDEVEILVELNSGCFASTAWGCDLTYDYVKINGDYRT